MSDWHRPTRLQINLSAIGANLRLLRAHTPASAALMAVVKADGYGHGAIQTGRVALENGASWLGVAIPEEGIRLREEGITAPILVLGGIAKEGAEAVAAYHLTQTVFDEDTVLWLEEAAARCHTVVDVHIKVDTGMGRVGVRSQEALLSLARKVRGAAHLRLTGLFTHFATADENDLGYTMAQATRFDSLVAAFKREQPQVLVHAANSSALLRCPGLSYDMVRAGIAMYINPHLPKDIGLSAAMGWITRGVYIKEIEPGESVSYGRRFTASRPTRVMTLPVGYADGYHRCIGGRGRALVRGQSAPVIGRVCMDQAMVDITDIPGASLMDEVVLLGKQGNEWISAGEMGTWCEMIDYEILLSPTARVPKVYVE